MKFLFVVLFVAIAVAQADYYDDDIFGLPRATQIFGEIDAGELNDWNKIIGTESVDVDGKEDKVVEKMIVFPKVSLYLFTNIFSESTNDYNH